MIKVIIVRWSGDCEMTYDNLEAALCVMNKFPGIGIGPEDESIEWVRAENDETGEVWELVNDNGFMWEPCSEGPY